MLIENSTFGTVDTLSKAISLKTAQNVGFGALSIDQEESSFAFDAAAVSSSSGTAFFLDSLNGCFIFAQSSFLEGVSEVTLMAVILIFV